MNVGICLGLVATSCVYFIATLIAPTSCGRGLCYIRVVVGFFLSLLDISWCGIIGSAGMQSSLNGCPQCQIHTTRYRLLSDSSNVHDVYIPDTHAVQRRVSFFDEPSICKSDAALVGDSPHLTLSGEETHSA